MTEHAFNDPDLFDIDFSEPSNEPVSDAEMAADEALDLLILGDDTSEFDGELIELDLDLDDEDEDGLLPGEDMDGDFDTGMASAGFGTDEDYGLYDAPDWD